LTAERLGSLFAALSDTHRRHLVEALARRESASLSELAAELPVTRQAVSKHLAALRAAGLVESRRSGRETRYRLTPEGFGEALSWIERVGLQWDARLEALRALLASEREGGD
jgi:DNA-binding transcriptional ArsR family regulator